MQSCKFLLQVECIIYIFCVCKVITRACACGILNFTDLVISNFKINYNLAIKFSPQMETMSAFGTTDALCHILQTIKEKIFSGL